MTDAMADHGDFHRKMARMTCYSCRADPRFSYYVYVPESFQTGGRPEKYHLVVLIHGSERSPEGYRNKFRAFAEKTQSVILAPLFPAGLGAFSEVENYLLVRQCGVEFDTALLRIIAEVDERFGVDANRLLMHGFSAGGQFAHRFFYLYAGMFRCISIGSMGGCTQLDFSLPWPRGLGGVEDIFGIQPDIAGIRSVPVHLVAGENDILPTPSRNSDPAMNRVEKMTALLRNYRREGLDARLDLVPGAGHNGFKVLEPVFAFFYEMLEKNP